jgi:hypothetical protein
VAGERPRRDDSRPDDRCRRRLLHRRLALGLWIGQRFFRRRLRDRMRPGRLGR